MEYPGVAVGIIIVNPENGYVLLGKRKRKRKGLLGAGQYAVPGGKIDFSETPFATVLREALEETNLRLQNVRFTGQVTNDYFQTQGKHYITLYYIAEATNPYELKTMEPTKTEGWEWYDPFKELPQPMWEHTGELLTSMTKLAQGLTNCWGFKTLAIDNRN